MNQFPFTIFEFKHNFIDREPEAADDYRRYVLEVIERCLLKHKSHSIVEGFQDLINNEIEETKSMGEKIKYYFKMTRIRKEETSVENIKKF